MRIILLFFFIICSFQSYACQSDELPKYESLGKCYPKNVSLYAKMYQLSEQEVSEKLNDGFPIFPEKADVILNVAVQAGNAEEVRNILDVSPEFSVQVLRTAMLFAHEECMYPGSHDFLPIGPRLVVAAMIQNRLKQFVKEVENNEK
ncbi:MAG: hypothetical protein WC747_00970 [Candidatus Babeliales bacterium]|jgi:hypothetical protein